MVQYLFSGSRRTWLFLKRSPLKLARRIMDVSTTLSNTHLTRRLHPTWILIFHIAQPEYRHTIVGLSCHMNMRWCIVWGADGQHLLRSHYGPVQPLYESSIEAHKALLTGQLANRNSVPTHKAASGQRMHAVAAGRISRMRNRTFQALKITGKQVVSLKSLEYHSWEALFRRVLSA